MRRTGKPIGIEFSTLSGWQRLVDDDLRELYREPWETVEEARRLEANGHDVRIRCEIYCTPDEFAAFLA